MKTFKIAALALLLNTPIAHAGGEEGCYSRFSREDSRGAFSFMIGVSSLAMLYGMHRINTALKKSEDRTPILPAHTSQPQNNTTLHDIHLGSRVALIGAATATVFWVYMTACESIAYNNKCE